LHFDKSTSNENGLGSNPLSSRHYHLNAVEFNSLFPTGSMLSFCVKQATLWSEKT